MPVSLPQCATVPVEGNTGVGKRGSGGVNKKASGLAGASEELVLAPQLGASGPAFGWLGLSSLAHDVTGQAAVPIDDD
jgi:hypothetical protein